MDNSATYISLPSPCRTPDRLATLAKIFDLTAANINTANVLDIGCGQGWDLIALACIYPEANFIGIDSSQEAVNTGKEAVSNLNLKNITLICQDFTNYNIGKKFDYIFCHGLYSWISEELGHKLLEVCHNLLAESGLAYISYNAMPAWSARSILHEALLHFTFDLPEEEKLPHARKAIDFILTTLQDYPTPYSQSLQLELNNLKKSSDGFIIQEMLAKDAHAEYLHTFVEKAAQHKLQYLCEAKIERMVSQRLDELSDAKDLCYAVRQMDTQIKQEQALEFLFPTWLRQAVLFKADSNNGTNKAIISPNAVKDLYIASPLVPSDLNDPEGGEDTFMNPLGSHIQIPNKYLRQALHTLNTTWPDWISVQELYDTLTNRPAYAMSDFCGDLIPLFQKGLVELHPTSASFTKKISAMPKVSPLACLQVKTQDWVTNLKLEYTNLTVFEKHLLPLLDGTRDKAALFTEIEKKIAADELGLKEEFRSSEKEINMQEIINQGIDEALEHLAESALLVA